MKPELKLKQLGITLPAPMKPAGAYVPALIAGNMAYVSGQGPRMADGTQISGQVPGKRSEDEAIEAARLVGINCLAALRGEIGSLDRVERVVRIFGLVNAAPGFTNHPKIIDGLSNLMVEVFGDAGRAARCAVGASSLPFDITVEAEMSVLLKD